MYRIKFLCLKLPLGKIVILYELTWHTHIRRFQIQFSQKQGFN